MAARTRATPSSNGAAETTEQIIILPIDKKILPITIVGVTPLITHPWSEKAQQQMLDAQMHKAKKGKTAKSPEEDFQNSRYISTEGWDGVPAGGIKGCLVNTCRTVKGLPMTLAKRILFVRADGQTPDGLQLVRLHGTPRLHKSMVRLDSGVADIRFRAMYEEWSIDLEIEFVADVISAEQVANLLERAGMVEGLCEHRPGAPKNNTGDHGRFMIKR